MMMMELGPQGFDGPPSQAHLGVQLLDLLALRLGQADGHLTLG